MGAVVHHMASSERAGEQQQSRQAGVTGRGGCKEIHRQPAGNLQLHGGKQAGKGGRLVEHTVLH